MPTLQSHTHCQAAQSPSANQSLSKSVSFPAHERKENKKRGTTIPIRNALRDTAHSQTVVFHTDPAAQTAHLVFFRHESQRLKNQKSCFLPTLE